MEKDQTYKYDVFISYRHLDPDEEIANALHKFLETFKIPKELSAETAWKGRSFIDRQELTARDLSDSIIEAIRHSKYFISVCSKRTRFSPWCIKEIELFRQLHGDDRIFVLLVEGEPEEVFPDEIRDLKKAPKTMNEGEAESREILAADVRPRRIRTKEFKGYEHLNAAETKDLKREAVNLLKTSEIYRIMGGILGMDYGDLRQRSRERRLKLMLGIAGIVSVAFAVFTSFMLMMYLRAKHSEKIARQQTTLMIMSYGDRAVESGDRLSALLIADKAMEYASEEMEEADYINTMNFSILNRSLYNLPYTGLAKLNIAKSSPFYVTVEGGYRIVSIGEKNNIEIWDTRKGEKLKELSCPERMAAIAANSSGSALISSSFNGNLFSWNLEEGSAEKIGKSGDSQYSEMAITENGRYLIGIVLTFEHNRLDIWDIEDKEKVFSKVFSQENPLSFAVHSPDGRHVAYQLRDGSITEVDLESRQESVLSEKGEKEVYFNKIAYSPEGDRFYYAKDNFLCMRAGSEGENTEEIDLKGNTGGIRTYQNLVYIETQSLGRRNISIVDPEKKSTVAVLEGKDKFLLNFMVNPANGDVVASWTDNSVSVWKNIRHDPDTQNPIYKDIEEIEGKDIIKFKFTDDGKYLLCSLADGSISIIDVEGNPDYTELEGSLLGCSNNFRYSLLKKGSDIRVYDTEAGEVRSEIVLPEGFDTFYTIFAISGDGKILAVTDVSLPDVVLVDTETKKSLAFTGDAGFPKEEFLFITDLVFSEDGKNIYVSFSNGAMIQYETATGKELLRYTDNKTEIKSLIVSEEGEYIALSLLDKKSLVLDGKSGQLLENLEGEVYSVKKRPEGGFNAIGIIYDDIFHYSSGGEQRIITTNKLREGFVNKPFNTNSISPDGKYLLTMISGGNAVLTDADNGIFIKQFGVPGTYNANAFFAADAKKIIYDSGKEMVRMESLYSIEELEEKKRELLGDRRISDQEMERIYKSR